MIEQCCFIDSDRSMSTLNVSSHLILSHHAFPLFRPFSPLLPLLPFVPTFPPLLPIPFFSPTPFSRLSSPCPRSPFLRPLRYPLHSYCCPVEFFIRWLHQFTGTHNQAATCFASPGLALVFFPDGSHDASWDNSRKHTTNRSECKPDGG